MSRSDWGPVSILASCETEEEVLTARSRGYAAAIVLAEHEADKLYRLGRVNVLPCPQETRGVSCADCRLCMDDARLRDANIAIGFALHGSPASMKKAQRALASKREAKSRTA